MAARAPREDVENQLGTVENRTVPQAAEVALLDRRQLLVEDRERRTDFGHPGADFLGLARTEEQTGIGAITPYLNSLNDIKTRRDRQGRQFIKGRRIGPLATNRDRHQQAAGDFSGCGAQFSVLSWE